MVLTFENRYIPRTQILLAKEMLLAYQSVNQHSNEHGKWSRA